MVSLPSCLAGFEARVSSKPVTRIFRRGFTWRMYACISMQDGGEENSDLSTDEQPSLSYP